VTGVVGNPSQRSLRPVWISSITEAPRSDGIHSCVWPLIGAIPSSIATSTGCAETTRGNTTHQALVRLIRTASHAGPNALHAAGSSGA
jgi:hypothetical protein